MNRKIAIIISALVLLNLWLGYKYVETQSKIKYDKIKMLHQELFLFDSSLSAISRDLSSGVKSIEDFEFKVNVIASLRFDSLEDPPDISQDLTVLLENIQNDRYPISRQEELSKKLQQSIDQLRDMIYSTSTKDLAKKRNQIQRLLLNIHTSIENSYSPASSKSTSSETLKLDI